MTSRDARAIAKWALRAGCKVRLTRSNHYKVTFEGRLIAAIPPTPSDHRSVLNTRAQIKRGIRNRKRSA